MTDSWFGRLLHRVSRLLFRNNVYRIRSGLGRGLLRQGGLGFLPQRISPEVAFLATLDLRGQTVVDAGGYEGIYTLAFARAVGPEGRVITFEPNPDNVRRIGENVRLNGFTNVEVRALALGREPGRLNLVIPTAEPARGSLEAEYQASLRQRHATRTIAVEVDSLDGQFAGDGWPRPDFVKIDVEAAELAVLEGMRRLLQSPGPALFIELHSGVDVRRLVQLLLTEGYALRHIESNTALDRATAEHPSSGHLYGRRVDAPR
jgi:FkbM family methyltransferase